MMQNSQFSGEKYYLKTAEKRNENTWRLCIPPCSSWCFESSSSQICIISFSMSMSFSLLSRACADLSPPEKRSKKIDKNLRTFLLLHSNFRSIFRALTRVVSTLPAVLTTLYKNARNIGTKQRGQACGYLGSNNTFSSAAYTRHVACPTTLVASRRRTVLASVSCLQSITAIDERAFWLG